MRYAVHSYTTSNLGDEIQSIAAMGHLPRTDVFIDRELKDCEGSEETILIANGWFQHFSSDFAYPDHVRPHFVSVHLTDPEFLVRPNIEFLRKHQPIGCRDLHTLELLRHAGIDAYFSGCLTLTLKPGRVEKRYDLVISDVDPAVLRVIPKELLEGAVYVEHHTNLFSLTDPSNMPFRDRASYRAAGFMKRALPLEGPSSQIEAKLLNSARQSLEGLHHTIVRLRFGMAQRLLETYEQARLVVTGRLHAALPCAAYGVPCMFFPKDPQDPRFRGLDPYLNIYRASEVGPQDFTNVKAPDVTAIQDSLSKDLAARLTV